MQKCQEPGFQLFSYPAILFGGRFEASINFRDPDFTSSGLGIVLNKGRHLTTRFDSSAISSLARGLAHFEGVSQPGGHIVALMSWFL